MPKLKPVEEVTAVVVDYGSFMSLAEKLAETMAKVYYYAPFEEEFHDVRDVIKAYGLEPVERIDEPLSPEILATADLFVFPDIGYGGLQRHLRSIGKGVWGHMGGDSLELYRDLFLETLKDLGLPVAPYKVIEGLPKLADYLKTVDNKWVKVNRFRRNMDTWKHIDFEHSERRLETLGVTFGSAKDKVIFVVQDDIESDKEIGYDGWCIDGRFPPVSFQGYEKKNELYLGSLLSDADLPEEIQIVNDAMAPILKDYGYRDWWATEIRVADGKPYFIDPTTRMPGQTGEHQLENCSNLAEVIWHGANGILIEPEFQWQFAAEATLHYDANASDDAVSKEWKTLHFPKAVQRWVKLYHYCVIDGAHHFPPAKTDEVGVVLGVGNTVERAIDHLKKNLDLMKGLPLHADVAGFAELLESIKEAEKEGMAFGGPIPEPKSVVA